MKKRTGPGVEPFGLYLALAALRGRQDQYLASSVRVRPEDIEEWPLPRRFWNNLMGMLGPVL